MNRSNKAWIEHLRSSGVDQNDALSDLRELLVSRLRRSFQTRDGVDAGFLEDITQEALVLVLKNLDQFEGRSQFSTWSTSIAIRLALTDLRRRHWKNVSLDHFLDGAVSVPTQDVDKSVGPEQRTQQKILIETVHRIINVDLTAKQRDALQAELMGMPLEEIGRRMGSNRNAIYKLTHDARKRLKAGLEASGYAVADIQTIFGW